MIELNATIRNAAGIHCRPSALIIATTKDYPGEARVIAPEGEADLRSIFELMALALLPKTQVTIRVTGPDEEQLCRKLVELFETHFDFPPRQK